MTPMSSPSVNAGADEREQLHALRDLLAAAPGPRREEFQRRIAGLERRLARGRGLGRALPAVRGELEKAVSVRQWRAEHRPEPAFDNDLPVLERREALAEAIAAHQVVVVCGETGSGKSTQLPQICLDLGRGVEGMIAHTQPRRIAARSLAARVAEELGSEVGEAVGYKVRFTDRVSERSFIKLATDGMLLAEVQSDPELRAYDTIIVDEAHERSLNIDFLLGYLKRLLPRRPDLKLIITSATIDPERFSRHFGDAPVVEVSGRTHPVEVRYRPLSDDEDDSDRDQPEAIVEAVAELTREGPGDILVFLSGEREIREAAEALRKHHPPGLEILPLFARLSAREQQRVFQTHPGRRVVLSTNVAETSLTVPGIRYVVDTGKVRLSRYSYRTKVQRLPIEPISRASADQRAGRCGRVAPGVCIRLYSEADYDARPAFTDPEIHRTNLASVILQMEAQGLGHVEDFPFVEPPDARFVRDGYKLLGELAALDDGGHLTGLGRRLARLPLDPRLGRMLVAGEESGALDETLILVAALSIQEPRERPMEAQQAADEAHAAFRDEHSDFVSLLNLWRAWRERSAHLSQRKLRSWCREHFLSYIRMREWQETLGQVRHMLSGRLSRNAEPADYATLHRCLLTGLVSNVATRDDQQYLGPRNLKLAIFPGSGLARRRPKWIVAAELVETRRVFARIVAEIQPQWVEDAAPHLVQRSYSDPYWDPRKARVRAFEKVTLYGLILLQGRRRDFGRIDPEAARTIFIREALVQGRLRTREAFLAHNRALVAELEALEAKGRRRDVVADEDTQFAFYDQRIPADVASGAALERWLRREAPDGILEMRREDLLQREADEVTARDYPDHLVLSGVKLPLRYHFEPGHPRDGVTLEVPLVALNQLEPSALDWLVPGLAQEKISALIKALPKTLRKNFVPAPDFARAVLEAVPFREGLLTDVLRRELGRMTGREVPEGAFAEAALPDHLRMNVLVVDEAGHRVDEGRDLEALQSRLGEAASAAFTRAPGNDWSRDGIVRWDFGELPAFVEVTQRGTTLRGYPALEDRGESVRLRLADSAESAASLNRAGVRRLYLLALRQQAKYLRKQLPGMDRLCLLHAPLGPCEGLKASLVQRVFDEAFQLERSIPRDEPEFRERLEAGRGHVVEQATALVETLEAVLSRYSEIRRRIPASIPIAHMDCWQDVQDHMAWLVYPGFVADNPSAWLGRLPRFLDGLARRIDKLERDPSRDRRGLNDIRSHWQRFVERCGGEPAAMHLEPALAEYREMLEEYRISLFAQELGVRMKVSAGRLANAFKAIPARS
ncbi:ATP-dependent RNA helicase HrpA [Ectothiorhodospiraceae bacterium WFHF3C12]|nr:ATP-dependent RNA helicase HrpA [Ectothiorhodospiraceae bacterium WFHF3C12]